MTHEAGTRKDAIIVLLHTGDSDYLERSLAFLRARSGKPILLVGDSHNRRLARKYDTSFHEIDQYYDNIWMDDIVRYRHNSWLPELFERFCIYRFKVLLNVMENEKYQTAIYMDSDIFILNDIILDRFRATLLTHKVATLSSFSTYFSGWQLPTLRMFIKSLETYFDDDANGDRHCDMNALDRFLKTLPPEHKACNLAESVPAYDRNSYGLDPNYSLSPISMRINNLWGYPEIGQLSKCHIGEHIVLESDEFYLNVPRDGIFSRLDFVHLNGYNKKFSNEFSECLRLKGLA